MKIAALDLGSNSFLCLICECDPLENTLINSNKSDESKYTIKNIISDQVEIVRLGEKISSTQIFQDSALERADACLQKFSKTIQEHRPDKIIAVATAAARMAKNSEKLFQICQKYKIPLKIISGDEEARITYLGSISKIAHIPVYALSSFVVIDIGGASTEIIWGDHNKIFWKKSFPVGGVKLTETLLQEQPSQNWEYKKNEVENFLNSIFSELKELRIKLDNYFDSSPTSQSVAAVAVAGTPTEIAKFFNQGIWDEQFIDGFQIDINLLSQFANQMANTTIQEKIKIHKITPGRADVILAGSLILNYIQGYLNLKSVVVSTRGVRYGVAICNSSLC